MRRSGAVSLCLHRWLWRHLPASAQRLSLLRAYGMYVHALVRAHAERQQYVGTFFLRNRPELELMRRLVSRQARNHVAITVLGCSKGAEVYSIAWALRGVRPDVTLTINAADICREVLEFAARGVYSIAPAPPVVTDGASLSRGTWRDQNRSIFSRMTAHERAEMFEIGADHMAVKPWLTKHVVWHLADAGDPALAHRLGAQDIVLANRFLCHMPPTAAERCLRNIAHLVKPGGYLFVSGIDLDVRTKLARELGWTPVMELHQEVHDGDVSLRQDWPLHYWGLEPFQSARRDRAIRYASVFQLGSLA